MIPLSGNAPLSIFALVTPLHREVILRHLDGESQDIEMTPDEADCVAMFLRQAAAKARNEPRTQPASGTVAALAADVVAAGGTLPYPGTVAAASATPEAAEPSRIAKLEAAVGRWVKADARWDHDRWYGDTRTHAAAAELANACAHLRALVPEQP